MSTDMDKAAPESETQVAEHAIAVIGMSCVFPGASNIEAFWSLLEQEICAVKRIPPERWDSKDLPASAAPYAGFIDDAACFDPAFFGISPKEAYALDPRQRLTLQLAWWALEDAGIAADSLKETRLGVFIGAVNGEFLGSFAHTDDVEAHMGIGMSNAIIANRISHVLGLRGPSMTIDTACSSSLVAVHQACRSLQAGDADLVLAGGVSLMLRPDSSVALGKGSMLAPDGLCKTFDASANGYGRGEGAGLVLLKRLSDALVDGDRIHAVIRGSATNHDGVSNGITAPNGLAQENLIQAAIADAGLSPSAIQYVEAHGTGTLLGDPTETRALGRTLGQQPRQTPLLIGSVKTNIGHLEAAAGIAGLIKLILALKHKKIPASLHYTQPNPHINFEQLRLQVVAQTTDWPANDEFRPRAASISAFGFGGANCHVVLEEFILACATESPEADEPDILLVSASSNEALIRLVQQTSYKLQNGAHQDFAGVCQLSRLGRAHLRHRLALVASSAGEAVTNLQAWLENGFSERIVTAIAARRPPKLAFLCPGQGSQRPGMARDLLQFASFRATIAEADAVLSWSLSQLLLNSDENIDKTAFTQPALLTLGVGLARLLAEYGVKPAVLAGHSLGEYTAAVIAGALSFEQALKLVEKRGRLMGALTSDGAMAAARADEQTVLRYLADTDISIAAVNGAQSVTISGIRDQLDILSQKLIADGIRVRMLRVKTAFHSVLLEPMLAEFKLALQEVEWQPLQVSVTSNLTGELLPVGHVYDTAYWLRHTREAVRFADNIATLSKNGIETALELGAVPVLSGMLDDFANANASSMRSLPCLDASKDDGVAFLRAVAHLNVLGSKLQFVDKKNTAAGDALPLYPFTKDVFPLRLGLNSFDGGNATVPPSKAVQISKSASASTRTVVTDPAAIRSRIIAIIAGLLAIDVSKVDATAPLLEIGADSLILMHAVGRIENEFSVKIPVRAFFENLTSIDAVAAYLAEQQAGKVVSEVVAGQQIETATLNTPVAKQKNSILLSGNLSDAQRKHLDEFSLSYCKKTALSKQQAQQYRHVLADSRASAGFRFSIKEMLYPIVGQRAAGSKIWDLDGNEYIDISMGFGVQLFGHEPEFLKEALAESLSRGIRIGPQSDMAGEVASLINELTGVERVAFCSSGTEAIMTALRLARTFTGRNKIAIFRDSYHGHFDGVLGEVNDDPWKVMPRVAGITPGMVSDLAFFEYGSAEALELLRGRLHEFAAVLVEPVQSRNPGLQPQDFLRSLRAMTRAAGSLLIFDEVLVGFRIHPGGAQAHFDVQADIVTYGKIVGGGLPVGVIAGRIDIMAGIDGGHWQYGDASYPTADTTFFAGTFNKHPLVMAAAHAVLTEIKRGGLAVYQKLNDNTARLTAELDQVFAAAGAPIYMKNFGSLFRFVFSENLDPFFYHLLYRGLYVWEGRNLFLSTAHTEDDIAAIVSRVKESVAELKTAGFIASTSPISKTEKKILSLSLPLSKAQKQLATLAALSEQGSAAYVVSVALELRGDIKHADIERAFTTLVSRHDALRASIDLDAGLQKIAPHVAVKVLSHQVTASTLDTALQNSVAASFDLTQAGAFRIDLFELDAHHAVLLFAAHHVFIDGQSMQMLFEEFAALMNGRALIGKPDYALLAQRMADAGSSPEQQEHKQYWLSKLQQAPSGIELPCAHARASMRGFQGQRLTHELDKNILRQLEQKTSKLGMSSSMALIAAFAASLRRAGAGRDMVLGVPYSGRDEALAHTPGYCAHLLPLRLTIPAQASTSEVLAEVKQQFLDAITHANYPLSQLVDDLGLVRDPARPPLVNITFNVDKLAAMPALPGVTVEAHSLAISHARFDIACNLVDWQDGARVELDFDSQLFDTVNMQELLDSFVAMIERMAGTDQDFDERAAARAVWLPARLESVPGMPGLLERFRQSAMQDPPAIALRLDATEIMTRQQLDLHSDLLAKEILSADQTAGPVLLLLGRSLAFPVGMLAAWKAGKAYLPVDSHLPQGRVLELIRQAKPCCVILQDNPDIVDALVAMNIPCLQLPTSFKGINPQDHPSLLLPATKPDACAYQLFTSGSTGNPKLVAVPHRAVQHYLDAIISAFDLQPGLRYAVISTFAADLGLTTVLPALFHGGCLSIISNAMARDADGYAALMQQTPVDVLKIVPSHLEALLTAQDKAAVMPLTHLILGGETASARLLQQLCDIHANCRIFNHFGPTEATIGVMVGEWQGDLGGMRFSQPLGSNRIHILDVAGQPCVFGEAGEIYLGGPGLALGYVGMPEDAADSFLSAEIAGARERVYRTGDLAVMHADGRMQILGRKDEQLKIRGYRIEPAEIIAVLMAQENVANATVILHKPESANPGRPYLLAYVVAVDKGLPLDTQCLLANLRQYLPDYMLPKAVIAINNIPYTSNGKLDRAALPRLDDEQDALESASATISGAEAALLAILRELLQRENLGPQADFFRSGGDSILAIQMIARLRQAGWQAKAMDLYAAPVLADFAKKLLPVGEMAGADARPEGKCRLLPAQLRLQELMQETPSHFNLSVLLEMADWVNAEMLEQVLRALIEQHDALRLGFNNEDAHFNELANTPVLHLTKDYQQVQATLQPAHANLLTAAWTPASLGQKSRLLLVVHHLVSDGISLQILLEDLRKALLDLQAGRTPALGRKTASLQAWAEHLKRQASQDVVLAEAEYWEICTSIPAPELPNLPNSGQAHGYGSIGEDAQVSVIVPAEITSRFIQGQTGVSAEDILIAALTLSLGEWTGEAVAYLELEGHGRQLDQADMDVSRSVGWFTSRYPAWFDLSDVDAVAAASEIAMQRSDIPAHGFGYGLLRYLGPEKVRAALAQGQMPEISLNYMGQINPPPDDVFKLLSWSPDRQDRGAERAAHLPRLHKMAIEAYILDGCLHLLWQYHATTYQEQEIRSIAQKMAGYIASILNGCTATEAKYGKEEIA
ncbi:MAG: aminotransferase class III-fold pyridoxal phosphate-dependent enzyme [Undibacterium umbellatum]|uniref:type I polyketide synthase n=1 Tax=Undibacterium umbellatum TaxID=2762300 RepID=UPI003BB6B30F